jgi:multiple sugar transport system substrate-binding protein/sn-glycerol 3-phosphate transport system substrate-binding protein
MKQKKINSLLVFQLLILVIITAACDYLTIDQSGILPTTSLVKTIHPATLTAISELKQPSGTPDPEPMGIPWSELNDIELEFWYVWDLDEPGEGLNAIVEQFNQENEWGITVNPVDRGLTLDPMDTIHVAFQEGVVPDVMISDAIYLAGWYETGLTADLNPFMNDPAVGFTDVIYIDYYTDILDSFILDGGIRPGLPFTQTIQVLYYNQTWAEELGFSSPPGTVEELKEQACAASAEIQQRNGNSQDLAGGILMYPEAANITSWIYAYEGLFIKPGEEDYQFSSPEVKEVALDWIDIYHSGCGNIISGYPNPIAREIEFEKFNQRDALMMMSSSQNIDQISMHANKTGRADNWMMLPFIGPQGSKAVTASIQSGVLFKTTPEKELAAWLFLNYLTSPEIQAEWVQYSGLYPTRRDTLYLIQDLRTENPSWSKGLDLLKYGQANPLHISWEIVRQAVGDAFEDLFEKEPGEVTALLKMLDKTAAELSDYSRNEIDSIK